MQNLGVVVQTVQNSTGSRSALRPTHDEFRCRPSPSRRQVQLQRWPDSAKTSSLRSWELTGGPIHRRATASRLGRWTKTVDRCRQLSRHRGRMQRRRWTSWTAVSGRRQSRQRPPDATTNSRSSTTRRRRRCRASTAHRRPSEARPYHLLRCRSSLRDVVWIRPRSRRPGRPRRPVPSSLQSRPLGCCYAGPCRSAPGPVRRTVITRTSSLPTNVSVVRVCRRADVVVKLPGGTHRLSVRSRRQSVASTYCLDHLPFCCFDRPYHILRLSFETFQFVRAAFIQ